MLPQKELINMLTLLLSKKINYPFKKKDQKDKDKVKIIHIITNPIDLTLILLNTNINHKIVIQQPELLIILTTTK